MLRCPECGSLVQEGSGFCPHCGRYLNAQDQITEEEFQAYASKPRLRIPWFLILCCVMLMLPAFLGMFSPGDDSGPDYGPMDKTVTWDFTDYRQAPSVAPVIHTFELTYTVNESELRTANSTPLPRSGSMLAERDAEGHYAVKDYVVAGQTVKTLCYDLWHMFSDFVRDNPQYDSPVFFADYLSKFVQAAVIYTEDPVTPRGDEYWKLPVETLYSLKGDCEDSSILLCAIFSAMSGIADPDHTYRFAPQDYIRGACCFGLPGHFMAGVDLTYVPLVGTPEYSYVGDGRYYYFCETTGEADYLFPIGYVGTAESLALAQFYPGFVDTYVTA